MRIRKNSFLNHIAILIFLFMSNISCVSLVSKFPDKILDQESNYIRHESSGSLLDVVNGGKTIAKLLAKTVANQTIALAVINQMLNTTWGKSARSIINKASFEAILSGNKIMYMEYNLKEVFCLGALYKKPTIYGIYAYTYKQEQIEVDESDMFTELIHVVMIRLSISSFHSKTAMMVRAYKQTTEGWSYWEHPVMVKDSTGKLLNFFSKNPESVWAVGYNAKKTLIKAKEYVKKNLNNLHFKKIQIK